MRVMREILRVSRPRFWLYTAGPYLLGYTASSSSAADLASPVFIAFLLYFLIPANIYLYGINDLFDRDTDALNPKKGSFEARAEDVGVERIAIAVIASLAISIAAVLILSGLSRLFMILYIVLATAYSTPPIRLKTRAFLDAYSNFLYAAPLLVGYSQNRGVLPGLEVIVAALTWTAAMHTISAVPDIEYDRAAGLNTTAVLLGDRGALMFCTTNWAVSAGIAVSRDLLLAPSMIYSAIALYLVLRPGETPKLYWRFPAINAVMGFLAFLYILYRKGFLSVPWIYI